MLRCLFKFCQIPTLYSGFHLILRITKEKAEIRQKALPFVLAHHFRNFDIIYEVNRVSLMGKRRFEFIAFYPNFDVVSEVNCVLYRRR